MEVAVPAVLIAPHRISLTPQLETIFEEDDFEDSDFQELFSFPKDLSNEWWDLCAGPHVETTGKINKKAVELESVAGAYWRGDVKKPMLQRIYGTAWENEDQLKAYLHFKEEAKRRDHRRLGQDLDLFSIQDEAGGGLVFWHPKGAIIRHIIEDTWKKIHMERGYDLLYTPHVAKADLWKISGHLDFYKENMFDQMEIEEELYQLRPMNCPYHVLVYKRQLHSYRDFPIRVAELGTVYRYELSGSLHGLFRVRGFTQLLAWSQNFALCSLPVKPFLQIMPNAELNAFFIFPKWYKQNFWNICKSEI
ncbi:PREDICTED: threonine--tRNA ligase, chloroplastic/mitochondrial 2-like [Nicotiana attenuata]|uniref:threonine--tRNA ligase, chloroplastic/mitochondrial 2-like n=1 Tax=Nicotiana attenuata TaxID=49451 RepID=UPI00090529FF|nr:PREDICTED: threonine--tRNA ligase, chloroplastic/mitochondrial 2-like [Nicotiana attenuata]